MRMANRAVLAVVGCCFALASWGRDPAGALAQADCDWADATPDALLLLQDHNGVAWGDYDNDGRDDLFVAGVRSSVLLHNDGTGGFSAATGAGLAASGDNRCGIWGDFDNDGWLDLYLTFYDRPNRLYRNAGSGQFVDVTTPELACDSRSDGAAWADFDRDGDLDLYVTCPGSTNRLLRNEGGGAFTRIDATPLEFSDTSRMAAWADYDNDGDLDVYLNNAGEANRLYRNEGDGTFVDATAPPLDLQGSCKGVAWGDYDNDGWLDLCVTRQYGLTRLFRNDRGLFSDATAALGGDSDGRGCVWADFDHDGALDLVIAKYTGETVLYRNQGGGAFAIATCGALADSLPGWGLATADCDADGDQDLALAGKTGTSRLLRNAAATNGHWLQIDLRGDPSNRFGVGARIAITHGGTTQIREIAAGSGYLSQSALTADFGLGGATVVDELVVFWPSGNVQTLTGVWADQRITVSEGQTGPPPDIGIDPESLDITMGAGETQARQLVLANTGEGPLAWRASAASTLVNAAGGGPAPTRGAAATPDWLSIDPTMGTLGPGGADTLTVTFRTAGLQCGEYTASIRIASNDPDEPNLTVIARLWVSGGPEIDLPVTALDFGSVFIGDSVTRPFDVVNLGCETLEVSIEAPSQVMVDPAVFSVAPKTSLSVAATFTPTTADTIAAGLILTCNDPDETVRLIHLAGESAWAPDISVSPPLLDVTMLQGETRTESITITNEGEGPLEWQALVVDPAAASGQAQTKAQAPTWITIEPATGNVSAHSAVTILARIAPTALPVGFYEADILVTSNDPDEPAVLLPASMSILGGMVSAAVTVSCAGLVDSDNLLGVQIPATDGYDADFDLPEAGAPSVDYLSGYFAHPEWPVPGDGRYAADVRAPFDPLQSGKTWAFEVDTDQTGPVTLTFAPSFGPGLGWRFYLLDEQAGLYQNLFPALTYTYDQQQPGIRRFAIVVGALPPPLLPAQRALPGGWSLIGFPLVPPAGHQTLQETILGDAAGLAYLFQYDEAGEYRQLDGSDSWSSGLGLWIVAADSFAWSMAGSAAPNGAEVALREGWSLIGHPLCAGIGLDAVKVRQGATLFSYDQAVAAGLVAGSAYEYLSATDSYAATRTLASWHGYWFASYQAGLSLVFDFEPLAAPGKSTVDPPPGPAALDWALRIDLAGGPESVTLGAAQGASAGFDPAWDLPAPPESPGSGPRPRIWLQHPEWGVSTGSMFLREVVSPADERPSWPVWISRPEAGPVTLQWAGSELPAGIELEIYDPLRDQVVVPSLRAQSGVTLDVGALPLELRIRKPVATTAVPDPASPMARLCARPNPANPGTVLHASLALGGAAEVRIYDIRGTLVRRLHGGERAAGPFSLYWDGRDGAGTAAPSGLYLCRLYLEGRRLGPTLKLSLVK